MEEITVSDDNTLEEVTAKLVLHLRENRDLQVAKTVYKGKTLRAWQGESMLKAFTNAQAALEV